VTELALIERVRRNLAAWRGLLGVGIKGGPPVSPEATTLELRTRHGSELKRLIEEAERQGREVGVMLCQAPTSEIHLSQESWGKRSTVTVVDCRDHTFPLGSFHVHLRGADVFSVPDLELGIQREKLSCVGYMKAGVPTLKCVTPQKYYEYPLSERQNIRGMLSAARADIERATRKPLTLANEQAAPPGERARVSLSGVEEKLGVYEVRL